MNDVTESEVGAGAPPDDEEATQKRLEELKKARNEMLEGMDPNIGGASEDAMPADLQANGSLESSVDVAPGEQAEKKEVSAATIGRMMGLVTLSEFKLVENKIDLLSTRMNSILVKMDKVLAALEATPTGSDLDRIDVQIGSFKTLLKEAVVEMKGAKAEQSEERVSDARILSNND